MATSTITMSSSAERCDEVRFFTRNEDTVNELLADDWVLLAAGTNPYGDATYVLGHDPNRFPKGQR